MGALRFRALGAGLFNDVERGRGGPHPVRRRKNLRVRNGSAELPIAGDCSRGRFGYGCERVTAFMAGAKALVRGCQLLG
jgi:hypothetical protein